MRANRGRSVSVGARFVAVGLAASMFAGLVQVAQADTKTELAQARSRLSQLERQIAAQHDRLKSLQQQTAAQRAKLDALQAELDRLAARVDEAQSRLAETQRAIAAVQSQLDRARAEHARLKSRLDLRARLNYERGPGGTLLLILGSATVGELSDRLQFMDQLSQSDADLANEVQDRANELTARRAELRSLEARQAAQLRQLQAAERRLAATFAEQQKVYDALTAQAAKAAKIEHQLASSEAEVTSLVHRLHKKLKAEELAAARAAARRAAAERRRANAARNAADPSRGGGTPSPGTSGPGPFVTCPVHGPHAYSDSFGAPRYGGGYHPHAGNDIMAPRGTPVVAPFAGRLALDYNTLGGNAFLLYGSAGYAYGAHLDRYARSSGSVSAGTLLGYVGDTGDARGGPTHLHFEWHPNAIPAHPYRSVYGYTVINGAIDPYPYLNRVC
jgi:peptidoglycan LD-endopeptidase LytH